MELNNTATRDGSLGRSERIAEMKALEHEYRQQKREVFSTPVQHNTESDGEDSNWADNTELADLRELADRYNTIREELGLPPRDL